MALVQERLGEPVGAWLAGRRPTESYDALAAELGRRTDVYLTGETVRRWYLAHQAAIHEEN